MCVCVFVCVCVCVCVCAVLNVVVTCSSFISCLSGMLLRYFLNAYEMVPLPLSLLLSLLLTYLLVYLLIP